MKFGQHLQVQSYEDVTCMLKYVTHYTGRSQISSIHGVTSASGLAPVVGISWPKQHKAGPYLEEYPKFIAPCYLLYTGL